MQVLVVEDEGEIANILRKGLLTDFYNVDIAEDGEEALEKILSHVLERELLL